MWGLGKLLPIFLAAKYSPKQIAELPNDFRNLYSTLGEKAPVYQAPSETLRFSFVTPPPLPTPEAESAINWRDDDVLYSDADIMETSNGDRRKIFQQIAERHGKDKPIALYLPGLDGFGISAAQWQFNDMSRTFELWRMSLSIDDRSSFPALVKSVTEFIDDVSAATERPVYVIGESFGGLLTSAVALGLETREVKKGTKNPVEGIVMVNPATSFDDTNWDVLAPLLVSLSAITDGRDSPLPFNLPTPYDLAGSLTLSALIPSGGQFENIFNLILSLEETRNPTLLSESIRGYFDMFKLTGESLPASLLAHRLTKWCMVGSPIVNAKLSKLETPTLVVVGSDDNLLPSKKEADRLKKVLQKSEQLIVPKAGHFTLDANVNLTEAMLYSHLDPLDFKNTKKPFDDILDWQLPSKEETEAVYNSTVKQLVDAFSPIFISTDETGRRSMGLDNIPRVEEPLLFVSNHQLLGLDLGLVISEFLDNDLVVRGLAHPFVFQNSSKPGELGFRTPGLSPQAESSSSGVGSVGSFRQFGAVMVTPRNYYRLLQTGQNGLLFPGGVREVFHGKDEAYQLFWPEKVDFVRVAARFNATIVPLSAVGMADSLTQVVEAADVENIPFIGRQAKEFAGNVTAARFDTLPEDESFLPPIVAPGLPSRNYFVFGRPFSTKNLDPSDREECKKVYQDLQTEMNRGFKDVLQAREKDRFKDYPARAIFERVTGRQAPTFDIEEVNKVSI